MRHSRKKRRSNSTIEGGTKKGGLGEKGKSTLEINGAREKKKRGKFVVACHVEGQYFSGGEKRRAIARVRSERGSTCGRGGEEESIASWRFKWEIFSNWEEKKED